jgi:phosphate transport system permease protein
MMIPTSSLVALIVLLAGVMYVGGRRRAVSLAGGRGGVQRLNSLPGHYGMLVALWCALPSLAVVLVWNGFDQRVILDTVLGHLGQGATSLAAGERGLLVNDIRNVVQGNVALAAASPEVRAAALEWRHLQDLSHLAVAVLALTTAVVGGGVAWRLVAPQLRARRAVERIVEAILILCSLVAILTTVGIVVSVMAEACKFFGLVSWTEFLFGTHWSPQMAIRADQVGSSGAFGAVPLFTGTLLIAVVAMAISVPIGLFAAIYLAEYADRRVRAVTKPLLELLAGIPTVVYGFFAALTVGPLLRDLAARVGLTMASESALAAGLVMGIMIIPFVSSLADDMITAVPQSLRDGSLALGATHSETIRKVVLRAALPGIAGGILLAVSRAIGETMIVVMAAGLSANLTANPLDAVTTVTVQIVTLLVGDSEFDSPKTLAAFALGLVLFVATLLLNIIALRIVRKYREQYE